MIDFVDQCLSKRLAAAGITRIEDLVIQNTDGLSRKAGISGPQAFSLIAKAREVLRAIDPPADISGRVSILGFPVLHAGALVELFGPAGAGKTQIAFSLAATGPFQLVFWIDTEGTYRSERLSQMGATESRLSQVRVRQVRDERGLLESLDLIRGMKEGARECLVVVDSITGAFRTTETKENRAKSLHLVANALKSLRCCVLVTNQVRAEISSAKTTGDFHAAMGAVWSSSLNSRLLVMRENGRRVLRVVKSSETSLVDKEIEFAVTIEGCIPEYAFLIFCV
jgi:RecA/RadA recombinase